jgi:hypothetical protein
MDVHKEATVIAVLNGSGKLVMESLVETKASSILQFIHGLRDELHVTWEEGPGRAESICSMLPEAGALDPADETRPEYGRVIDPSISIKSKHKRRIDGS